MGGGVLLTAMGGLVSAAIIIAIAFLIYVIKKYVLLIDENREKSKAEGKLAYQNQVDIKENPYPESDKARHFAWRKGWKIAEDARSNRGA
jgi:hypothetical protein